MGIDVDVIDNSEAFKAAMRAGVEAAITAISERAERNVKAITPVGTPESTGKPGYIGGTLRNSISGEPQGDTAYIGTNVEYAAYVELGTYKMAAQPYLRPGVTDHMDEYRQIAINEIKANLP